MISSMKKKTAFIASRIEILVDFERAMVAGGQVWRCESVVRREETACWYVL